MELSTAFPLRGSFSQMLSLVFSLKKRVTSLLSHWSLSPAMMACRGLAIPQTCRPGTTDFCRLITLPLVINYGFLGSAKKLRAQSVAEVSAYYSWVLFSGYVEMQVSQAYNNKKLATLLACINTVEIVQRTAARWVLNRFDRKDSVTEMLSTPKWQTL